MFRHMRPVWAEIDLDKLAHNMREIRRISTSREIMAVVKADAYGHGALDVAPVLLQNGADRLAVAVLSEAIELRKGGIDCPIMILGFTPPSLFDELLEYDIEQTIYSIDCAEKLSQEAQRKNKIAKIHVKIDSGMGRIGYEPNDKSVEEICKISALPNIEIEGIFTHFSSADDGKKEYTILQNEKFMSVNYKLKQRNVKINNIHVANSATIIDLPEYHYDIVRPGIILYGYYPSNEVNIQKIDLKPVMSLKTNVIHIKEVHSGEYIGYGRKFRTDRESVIATLPIGYADGYTRLFFNKAKVIVKEKFAPIIGRICMDQCMIDVTDVGCVKIGDEVILIGGSNKNKITADDLAELLGTISYEIVCMIGKRVPRVYIKNNKVEKVRRYI